MILGSIKLKMTTRNPRYCIFLVYGKYYKVSLLYTFKIVNHFFDCRSKPCNYYY